MTSSETRVRIGPIKAAILRAALPARALTFGHQPRKLTRRQRMRTWIRWLVGLPPLVRDLPWESKPMPQNTTGTVTFRRTLPQGNGRQP